MTHFDAGAFRRDGFATACGAVSPAIVAKLAAAVERIQAGVADLSPELRDRLTLERDLPAERRGGADACAVGDAIFILGDPAAFDDAFLLLLDAPGVVGPVREALATTAVAAHFMNVTIKHPRWGRALGWHRDYPNGYACPAESRFVRAMLCLDGMDEASGATTFVPGSHRIGDEAARGEAGARVPPSPRDVVAVRCAPGDLVLIHPKVLHGGGMNTSARSGEWPGHVHDREAWPPRVRTSACLLEAKGGVERDVSLHAGVREQAQLGHVQGARLVLGQSQQGEPVAFALAAGPDRDAVDHRVVRVPFEHEQAYDSPADFGEMDLSDLNPRPVVLRGGQGRIAEQDGVGRVGRLCERLHCREISGPSEPEGAGGRSSARQVRLSHRPAPPSARGLAKSRRCAGTAARSPRAGSRSGG